MPPAINAGHADGSVNQAELLFAEPQAAGVREDPAETAHHRQQLRFAKTVKQQEQQQHGDFWFFEKRARTFEEIRAKNRASEPASPGLSFAGRGRIKP